MTDPAAPQGPAPEPEPAAADDQTPAAPPDPVDPNAAAAPDPAARRLPPDPVQYDSERNVHARRRGLPQPYIAGGDDPQLAETLRRERRYVRWLVIMVAAIVALGFVLGLIGAILASVA